MDTSAIASTSRKINPGALDDALIISRLLSWIEQARYVCDTLSTCARLMPDLEAQLRLFDIPFNAAQWEEQESDALAWLICLQQDRLDMVATRERQ